MSNPNLYNTILIKRRLASSQSNTIPVLSGGELAFSEKNHTLYYGAEAGTITIGGSGAFVTVEGGEQTISSPKTFTELTTLSSVTFSPGSVIDAGQNVIGNVADPVADTDVVTKGYLTSHISALSGVVNLTDEQSISGVKTFANDIIAGANLTVTGNLSVLGTSTIIDTTVSVTSAFSVVNAGSEVALSVTQTGSTDVAVFYDDADTALIIKNGGNVGIGIAEPGEKLTVSGVISASDYALLPGVNDLKVTTWGLSTVKLSNKVDGDNIYIQSTDDGRSILRWHSRADYGSGNNGQFSQIQAQNDGVWIKNESWSGGNYHHKWHFDNNGSITFPTLNGNDGTGSGENLQFAKSANQKIISTAAGTIGQVDVESLIIAGGDSYQDPDTNVYQGEGGDVYVWAGKGATGGDVKVQAGEGVTEGGYLRMHAGYTLSGSGGFVELYAGDSDTGNGGPVDIRAGSGATGGGNITLQTSQGGTHQVVLSATGELFIPVALVTETSAPLKGFVIDCGTF